MVSTSSKNFRCLYRDHSTIRMGNKSTSNTYRVDNSTCSCQGSLGLVDLYCIRRNYSTIGMGYKVRRNSWDYCTIGICDQSSRADSNTGSKYQTLHDAQWSCVLGTVLT